VQGRWTSPNQMPMQQVNPQAPQRMPLGTQGPMMNPGTVTSVSGGNMIVTTQQNPQIMNQIR
jgi:hypothetical protein